MNIHTHAHISRHRHRHMLAMHVCRNVGKYQIQSNTDENQQGQPLQHKLKMTECIYINNEVTKCYITNNIIQQCKYS